MYELTATELNAVRDAMEAALEELDGVEEYSDYVLTVGAVEALQEALVIIKAVKKNGRTNKTSSDT